MGSKEYKFKENERMNEELRSKVLRLEEDIELMANKLRNNSNINKASNSNKKNDKQDMKIVETLVNEKNELKAELNRVGREKNRFEVMVKDMSEILEIKEINIMALANKVCELDMIDRETVLKGLVPEDKERVKNAMHNKSLPDMKQLIEKVIIDNISLKKEINLLKAKKMIG